jgi:hypothetical protein
MLISLIVIFVAGLTFADYEYRPMLHGQTRWERIYHPATESERYVVTEGEKTGLIAGVFSAANWLVSGTLDMAGATYDGTEKMTKDVLTSSGNTIDATMDTSGAIIDGSLKKSGEIINGTIQFTDDTVRGTTRAVMGSEK